MKKLLIAIFISLFAMQSMAQIKDVTFTVSPVAEYIWWDSNTTLSNTPLWGVRAGFGIGPIFEVRAFYQQSFDVKSSLRQLDWQTTSDWSDKMKESNVNIIRKGGEIKINFVTNVFFSPYFTAGGGVQTLKYGLEDPNNSAEIITRKEDQLFGALGLGTKFNLSRRVVLSLEGRGTFFNANEGSNYLKPSINFDGENSKLMRNWSALASLDFYFGGVDEKNSTNVSSAYNRMFADGFRGIKFVLEPGAVYFDANDQSDFSDQYFLGGAAGIDFSSLVGIRGFYYQATQDPTKLSLKFNKDLAMYGGYFLFRLNQPRGVTPYLTLGAGYLDAKKGYATESGNLNAKSTMFASSGLGLEVPLSKYFALYGTYNIILIPQTGVKANNVQAPSQIKTNTFYNVGLRINLGKSANANDIYKRSVDKAILIENTKNNERFDELKTDYQSRIDKLTKELDKASEENNTEKASKILTEKKQTEKILLKIEENESKSQAPETTKAVQTTDSTQIVETASIDEAAAAKLIRIDSEDFEALVNRILSEIKKTNSIEETSSRLKLTPLEMRLLQKLNTKGQLSEQDIIETTTSKDAKIIEELSEISRKLDRNFAKEELKNENTSDSTIIKKKEALKEIPKEEEGEKEEAQKEIKEEEKEVKEVKEELKENPEVITEAIKEEPSKDETTYTMDTTIINQQTYIGRINHYYLTLNRISALTGLGFGESFSWNSAVRAHLQILDSSFDLVPEIYAAIGKNKGIAIAANVVYNFGDPYTTGNINPYVGLGIGSLPANKIEIAPRLILGTSMKLSAGNLFIDYSCNNLFKQNQIACGYQFVF